MKFDINKNVRVKLTDFGRSVHRKNHDDLIDRLPKAAAANLPYQQPHEDKDGWSEWQLWVLMNEFGYAMNMTNTPTFETTIELIGVRDA